MGAASGATGPWPDRHSCACGGGACQWLSHDELLTWKFAGYAAGDGVGPTWEMPDLFTLGRAGGDPLTVFKTGMENGTDFWATGAYNETCNAFMPGVGSEAVRGDTTTQQVDFGTFYASKSFLAADGRRVIIGAVTPTDGPLQAWHGLQSSPRTISIDPTFDGRLLFWPVSELESLRVPPHVKLGPLVLAPREVAGGQVVVHSSFRSQCELASGAGR